jgi:hypothetical protein
MAFRQTSSTDWGGWRLNIDWTVGPGKWNRPDDVMLVQNLLNLCYMPQAGVQLANEIKLPKGETSLLKIDGILGAHTMAFWRDLGLGPALEPMGPEGVDVDTHFSMLLVGSGALSSMPKIALHLLPGNFILGNSLNKPIRPAARKFTQRTPS